MSKEQIDYARNVIGPRLHQVLDTISSKEITDFFCQGDSLEQIQEEILIEELYPANAFKTRLVNAFCQSCYITPQSREVSAEEFRGSKIVTPEMVLRGKLQKSPNQVLDDIIMQGFSTSAEVSIQLFLINKALRGEGIESVDCSKLTNILASMINLDNGGEIISRLGIEHIQPFPGYLFAVHKNEVPLIDLENPYLIDMDFLRELKLPNRYCPAIAKNEGGETGTLRMTRIAQSLYQLVFEPIIPQLANRSDIKFGERMLYQGKLVVKQGEL